MNLRITGLFPLAIMLLLLPTALVAQQVQLSESINISDNDLYSIIGKYANRYLLFVSDGDKPQVILFDEKLQRVGNAKDIVLDGKDQEVISIINTKSDFSIVYQYRQKGQRHVKIHRYNPSVSLTDSIVIKTISSQRLNSPEYKLIVSEDNKNLLLYYFEDSKKVHLTVFDIDKMEPRYEKMLLLQGIDDSYELEQILIDNQGNSYFVLDHANESDSYREHHYEVLRFGSVGEESRYNLSMDGLLTYSVKFAYDNVNNCITGVGMYSEKNRGRAKGLFFLQSKYNAKPTLQYNAFDDELMTNIMGKKVENGKGLENIEIQDIVLRRDGGALLVAEQVRVIERQNASPRGFMSNELLSINDFYNDNVLVASFHPDGKLHWKNILFKRQFAEGTDFDYTSFGLLRTTGNLRFVYNDEVKLETVVNQYVMNGDGQMLRTSLFNTGNNNLRLMLRSVQQVGSNEVIIPSDFRNNLKLVKMIF